MIKFMPMLAGEISLTVIASTPFIARADNPSNAPSPAVTQPIQLDRRSRQAKSRIIEIRGPRVWRMTPPRERNVVESWQIGEQSSISKAVASTF